MASERLSDGEICALLCVPTDNPELKVLHRALVEIQELRSLRSSAARTELTEEEVEEIEWLIRRINEGEAGMNPKANHAVVLLGALAKLLAGAGGGGR